MEEDEKKAVEEADMGEGSSIANLALKQVLMLWASMPAVPQFGVAGPSDQLARRVLAASLRAWGKAPAIQVKSPLPAEMDKELAHRL